MTLANIIALKDFILSKNSYLSDGYANVFKDEATGQIIGYHGDDIISIFPDDTNGNYFYMRNEEIKFTQVPGERITDNGAQRNMFIDNLSIVLIAIVAKADAFTLMNNLRNTMAMFTGMDITPTGGSFNRENIVIGELRGSKPEDIRTTLQNLNNQTIIKLNITAQQYYQPNTCIYDCLNPCI